MLPLPFNKVHVSYEKADSRMNCGRRNQSTHKKRISYYPRNKMNHLIEDGTNILVMSRDRHLESHDFQRTGHLLSQKMSLSVAIFDILIILQNIYHLLLN